MLDPGHRLRRNFTVRELECKCGCGYGRELEHYDEGFLDVIQAIRDLVGHALVVNSGLRCESHNREVDGVLNSAHTRAMGVDFRTAGSFERRRIVDAAVRLGAAGIGVAKTFVHVDDDRSGLLPRPGVWSY